MMAQLRYYYKVLEFPKHYTDDDYIRLYADLIYCRKLEKEQSILIPK